MRLTDTGRGEEGGREVERETGWRKMKEQDRGEVETLDQTEKGRQSVPFRVREKEWVDGL